MLCAFCFGIKEDNMNISRSKTANIINRLIYLGYIEKENRTRGRGEKIPQELVRERLKKLIEVLLKN